MNTITIWLLITIGPNPATLGQFPDQITCLVAAADIAIKAVDAGGLIRTTCIKSEIVKP